MTSPATVPPPPTARYWWGSLLLSAALFTLGILELSARRGWVVNLYLINKVLAGTALVMIALAMTLSALHYFWGVGASWRSYPRFMGLVAYGYAAAHVGLTLLVGDPEQAGQLKFPFPDYYLEHWPSILCSVAAFVLLTRVFADSVRNRFTDPRLRARLRWSVFAVVLLGFVHAALLKVAGWATWFRTFEPRLPPLSLLVALLVLALIGLKTAHLVAMRRVR